MWTTCQPWAVEEEQKQGRSWEQYFCSICTPAGPYTVLCPSGNSSCGRFLCAFVIRRKCICLEERMRVPRAVKHGVLITLVCFCTCIWGQC